MTGVEWAPTLPDGWGSARLQWLATIYAGGTPSKDNPEFWIDGTIPWLNSGSANDWEITAPSSWITADALASSSARWIPRDSVVMALAGQGRTKGTAARLAFQATCNQSMAAIVPGPHLDFRYLHHWLESNYDSIRNLAGGDSRDGLNLQHVGSIECPVPPLEEQLRIADFLDDQTARINRIIAGRGRQLTEATRLLDSTLDRAFRLDIPMDTPRRPLRALLDYFEDGDWIEAPYITDEGIRLIQTGNIGLGVYKEQGFKYIADETFSLLRCKDVLPGDLLISRLGSPVARACIAPDLGGRAVTAVDVVIARPNRDLVSSRYLVLFLSSPQHLSDSDILARGATMQRLSRSQVGSLRVPLPGLADQAAMAARIDEVWSDVDAYSHLLTRSIAVLQEFKRSLTRAAAVGEFDVSAASGRGVPQ